MPTTPPKYTRPDESVTQARQRILQSALEEFAERGFDGATVRSIAGRVGVTHGLLRYHYATKEQLWCEAVAFLFERQANEISFTSEDEQRFPAGSRERLAEYLRRYVSYCARHPEHARILMQETGTPSSRMERALATHLKPLHQIAVEEVRAWQERGVLNTRANPASLLYLMSGACQNLFCLAPEAKVTLDYDALTPEAITAYADLVIETFAEAALRSADEPEPG